MGDFLKYILPALIVADAEWPIKSIVESLGCLVLFNYTGTDSNTP